MSARISPLAFLSVGVNLLGQLVTGPSTREVADDMSKAVDLAQALVRADTDLDKAEAALRSVGKCSAGVRRQLRKTVAEAETRRADLLARLSGAA